MAAGGAGWGRGVKGTFCTSGMAALTRQPRPKFDTSPHFCYIRHSGNASQYLESWNSDTGGAVRRCDVVLALV